MQINIHNVKRFTYWGHLQRLFKAMNSGRGSVFKTQNMKISTESTQKLTIIFVFVNDEAIC